METTTSSLSPHSTVDSMISSSSPAFLNPEELHFSTPSSLSLDDSLTATHTPPPVIVHSKPAKKRKSWGQELPEPKTTLPPRKRAKTDDEKEQRRIERIKRNRAAAHNSRERKRQETETLAVALARANAELDAYRKHFGQLPSSVILPEVTLSCDGADTPAPSLIESTRGSVDMTLSPATPMDDDIFDCPMIKEEPLEHAFPSLDNMGEESKPMLLPPLDPTQHSAVMLCDLQCRSTGRSSRSTLSSPLPPSWWSSLFIYLMTLQLQTTSQTLLLALWTIWPSRIQRMMRATTAPRSTVSTWTTTSTWTHPLLLPSASRALAQRNAATSPLPMQQRGAALEAAFQRRQLDAAQRLITGTEAARRLRQRSKESAAMRRDERRRMRNYSGKDRTDDGVRR